MNKRLILKYIKYLHLFLKYRDLINSINRVRLERNKKLNQYLQKIYFKRRRGYKAIELPTKLQFLYNRKSCRFFLRKKISLNIIKEIINVAYGIIKIEPQTKIIHRTTPSAGAFYPLILVYIDLINGKAYQSSGYNLELIKNFNPKEIEKIKEILGLNFFKNFDFNKAGGVILILSNLSQSILKYGFRAYYFSLIESGHVAQNIYIYCASKNNKIGCCEIGYPVSENKLKKFLHILKNPYVFHSLTIVIGYLNKTKYD
ncbi:MAG: hypothetical protein KatS3mg095_0945 [Candidatus Parcubacteria bacterium]|nr:MAG: hypothetical protein KatS3mg095_0945 [Candidatus Parcubacteria bacterium]